MKRLYHHLVKHRWGEPADLIVFDRNSAAVPGALEQVHVAIWDADERCGVTTFMTLGMSELMMPHADYRAELTLGVRGALAGDTRRRIPMFLANVSEYPFMHQRTLNWWERLANPGEIPGFPDCPQLLLAPMFGDSAFKHFPAPDEDVKVLSLIPVTAHEGHLLKERGAEAFLDYWEESGVDLFAPRRDPIESAESKPRLTNG
jgi:hypothetical protein